MLIIKLAIKNLLGAGLRTWLNVIALSFSYVAIIFMQGLYAGMNNQMEASTIKVQYGGGQYWHELYDPYDPLSLDDSHAKIPNEISGLIKNNDAASILIRQGSIYPNGRMQNILIKGIDPNQKILAIPTYFLKHEDGFIAALIGGRMAKSSGLKKGDFVTIRWRDAKGTFDADEVKIVEVINTEVSEIDNGQIWIPLDKMREMTAMPGEATIIVLKQNSQFTKNLSGWEFKNLDFLLADLRSLATTKSAGASIFYFVLLLLAMFAIFDTQILSIFRRRKEMGTLMALGMTRSTLIKLFTLEGSMHAVLAAFAAMIYGGPLVWYVAKVGYGLPASTDSFGFALGDRIYPEFTAFLIIGTILLVLIVTSIVSYLPTRRIAKLKPTDALKGKMT